MVIVRNIDCMIDRTNYNLRAHGALTDTFVLKVEPIRSNY